MMQVDIYSPSIVESCRKGQSSGAHDQVEDIDEAGETRVLRRTRVERRRRHSPGQLSRRRRSWSASAVEKSRRCEL